MATRNPQPQCPARFYRLLLLLYPPDFRQRFGPEMVQIYQSNCAHLEGGFAARVSSWLWTLHDLARSAPGEWRQTVMGLNERELPVSRWADGLVVPMVVLASIFVAGDLGATVVQSSVTASRDASNLGLMVTTCVAVGAALLILGALCAWVAARSTRAKERWIRLSL